MGSLERRTLLQWYQPTKETAVSGSAASPADPILVAAVGCESRETRACGMISANIGIMDQTTPIEELTAPFAEPPPRLTRLLELDGRLNGSVTPRDNRAVRRTEFSLSAMIALRLDGIVSYSTISLRQAILFGMHMAPIKGGVRLLRFKLISLGAPGECFDRVYNQRSARPLFITQAKLP